jgi:negative regulator of replication initiation
MKFQTIASFFIVALMNLASSEPIVGVGIAASAVLVPVVKYAAKAIAKRDKKKLIKEGVKSLKQLIKTNTYIIICCKYILFTDLLCAGESSRVASLLSSTLFQNNNGRSFKHFLASFSVLYATHIHSVRLG